MLLLSRATAVSMNTIYGVVMVVVRNTYLRDVCCDWVERKNERGLGRGRKDV
jgi:hypothetical protein